MTRFDLNKDWFDLMDAIDQAEDQTPCVSYPDAYYPEKGSNPDRWETMMALKLCQDCPVKQKCLEYALKHESKGIWGGMLAQQRKLIRRNLAQDQDHSA
jgi:WhiB family redox-sensing transcriptional regulator